MSPAQPNRVEFLVTGFEPFGGDPVNASALVADELRRSRGDVAVELLPVTFTGGPAALLDAAAGHRPARVVCLGEAGGRSGVTPERFARNLAEARIPDNAGDQPRQQALDAGPEVLATTADVDALVAAGMGDGVTVAASDDAGTFVCNAVYRAALRDVDPAAVFIHVPALRDTGTAGVGAETDGPGEATASSATVAEVARAVSRMLDRLRESAATRG